MSATLSIWGLYHYDNTIFNNMKTPTGFTSTDKTTLVNNIITECAELEFLYPRPDFAAWSIEQWSTMELPTWQRIYNVSIMEYNPLENYNRTELTTENQDNSETHSGTDSQAHTGTDTETHSGTDSQAHTGTDTETHSGTDSEAHTGTDTETNSGSDVHSNTGTDTTSGSTRTALDGTDTETHSGNDVVTFKKAAFDTNTMVDTESQTTANGHIITKDMDDVTTVTESGSMVHGHTLTDQHGHVIANQHGETITDTHGHIIANQHGETVTDTHGHVIANQHGETVTDTYGHIIAQENEITRESHITGNIGVMTSQQMATQEVEVAAKLNVFRYIIDSFKKRFCIMVY